MNDKIEHKGTITEITNNKIVVRIISSSMCSSCHARGVCGSLDSKEKNIEVKTTYNSRYRIGDEVTVCLEQKMGYKAVLIGFFLPFIVLFITAFLFNKFIFPTNEVLTALSSLLAVAIYYFIIYALRNKIDKEFYFQIK